MRQTQIFSGSSHPSLVDAICERLGSPPAKAELGKFSNGETKVNLRMLLGEGRVKFDFHKNLTDAGFRQKDASIRDQDVFIVQSGTNKINDNVMELLIMISACKGGSARSITAVMPYFPYSRASKQKSHRGAISARMLANLLGAAGVNHVITIDLHASQMQGFFHCPVDNLTAEPLIANWIKHNVKNWKRAVVVSKNPGGTKRVTKLADALKLDFGIIMTDRRRPGVEHMSRTTSMLFDSPGRTWVNGHSDGHEHQGNEEEEQDSPRPSHPSTPARRLLNESSRPSLSPLQRSANNSGAASPGFGRTHTAPSTMRDHFDGLGEASLDDLDPRSRDVITGRIVHGHLVDDDAPSPSVSYFNTPPLQPVLSHPQYHTHHHHNHPTSHPLEDQDHVGEDMTASFYSTTSSVHHNTPAEALGGTVEATASSDDEEEKLLDPVIESTVTLVGKVRDRPVILLDDMIDKSASWIAAAETVVKRGGATAVWCIATHGIFDGGRSLREMEECEFIDGVVVTNSLPILMPTQSDAMPLSTPTPQRSAPFHGSLPSVIDGVRVKRYGKLTVLDVSWLLSEAVRRNHHGESISQLFLHYE